LKVFDNLVQVQLKVISDFIPYILQTVRLLFSKSFEEILRMQKVQILEINNASVVF